MFYLFVTLYIDSFVETRQKTIFAPEIKSNEKPMKKSLLVLTLFSIFVFHSCKSYQDIAYLQNVTPDSIIKIAENIAAPITSNDALIITVSSSNPAAVAVYNPPVINPMPVGETRIQSTMQLQTYQVDAEGYIDFPGIGKLKVVGLSAKEVEKMICAEIEPFVSDPIVKVQIEGNKVTILGEVVEPGVFEIPNERLTVLEALSMAKDMTIYGRRDNILVVRETENGEATFFRLDLTKSDVFTSPAFYLKKNDVVYVEPNKYRKSNSSYNSSKQFNISVISTVISGVSVIATLILAILK